MASRREKLLALAARWGDAPPAERANAQSFLIELCEALEVERPGPSGSGYAFEYPVRLISRSGKESVGFADLYRDGCFLLEAKHLKAGGTGEEQMRAAWGQALDYARSLPSPPPYVLVLDVGRTLLAWDRWSGGYGGFNLARRVDLRALADRPEDVDFLRAVWEAPGSLDPGVRGRQVTREVAERLAELSASLEGRGFGQERVARFLMRCVFTMFAEDVDLLRDKPFQAALELTPTACTTTSYK